ncbi:MAG: hypothetical protein E6706_01385 [Anaerococcus hydrogenalis]|nr:hypothetical protein [Anaerococcus hydrogenalis]
MTRVFLKDMLDKKAIGTYIIFLVLFYVGGDYLLERDLDIFKIDLGIRFVFFISFALMTTVYFFIKSYTGSDKILPYYALIYDRKDVNLNLLIALIIDSIFRKLSFIFIFLYLSGADYLTYIFIFISVIIVCSLSLVMNATNVGKIKKVCFTILGFALIAFLYPLNQILENPLHILLIYSSLSLIYIFLIYKFYFSSCFINSKNDSLIKDFNIGNYFLKFILSERVYLINTLFIIILIVVVSLLLPSPINMALAFAVATINSPLLSIFSTEKGLRVYEKTLPDTYISLRRQYLTILIIYFLFVNGLVREKLYYKREKN